MTQEPVMVLPNGDILRKGWTVKEDVNTAFVKADIDTHGRRHGRGHGRGDEQPRPAPTRPGQGQVPVADGDGRKWLDAAGGGG